MTGPGDARAFWDARYAEPGFAYGEAPNDFLAAVASRLPSGRALCLAEGEGRNAVFLAERGHDVTAVDLSAPGLDKARALAARRGVILTTTVADLADYTPERDAYDVVVAIWMHLPRAVRAEAHRRAIAALRPGGAFVLEAYTPAQLAKNTGGPRDEAMLVDPAHLREELAGLELATFDVVERVIREGKYHDGESATVQVLGFRVAA